MADGTLKVGQITTSSGSGTITLGQSGETVTIPSGATVAGAMANTPAFEATLSSDQTVANNTFVKAAIGTEVFDTDGCYDTSTYRFTPTVGGKYFIYASIACETDSSQFQVSNVAIYKNGSIYAKRIVDPRANPGLLFSIDISSTLDMNGSSDYVEIYLKIYKTGGTNIKASSGDRASNFGAYRIIGA